MQNYRVKRSISSVSEEYIYEIVLAHYGHDKNILDTSINWPIGHGVADLTHRYSAIAKAFNRPVIELIDGQYVEVE